jgi:hypothetical protein
LAPVSKSDLQSINFVFEQDPKNMQRRIHDLLGNDFRGLISWLQYQNRICNLLILSLSKNPRIRKNVFTIFSETISAVRFLGCRIKIGFAIYYIHFIFEQDPKNMQPRIHELLGNNFRGSISWLPH